VVGGILVVSVAASVIASRLAGPREGGSSTGPGKPI
jgi:hypothetical protein